MGEVPREAIEAARNVCSDDDLSELIIEEALPVIARHVLASAAEGLRERAEYPHHRPNGKKDEFTSTFDYMGKGVTEAVADWLERFAREWADAEPREER